MLRAILRASYYRDSVALMRVAQALRAQPGVREAAALAMIEAQGGIFGWVSDSSRFLQALAKS